MDKFRIHSHVDIPLSVLKMMRHPEDAVIHEINLLYHQVENEVQPQDIGSGCVIRLEVYLDVERDEGE